MSMENTQNMFESQVDWWDGFQGWGLFEKNSENKKTIFLVH